MRKLLSEQDLGATVTALRDRAAPDSVDLGPRPLDLPESSRIQSTSERRVHRPRFYSLLKSPRATSSARSSPKHTVTQGRDRVLRIGSGVRS